MNIIFFPKSPGRPRALRLTDPRCYLGLTLAFVVGAGLVFGLGYWVGNSAAPSAGMDPALVQAWKTRLEDQKRSLDDAREEAQAYVDALSLRIGHLQAQVMRLNALGQRLTKMAELDEDEFNFDQAPAQGGPVAPGDLAHVESPDIMRSMEQLATELDDHEQKLSALETMLLHGNLQEQVHPAGRPISKGWLSSYYGKRADPFTGKKEFHDGLDFAGKKGSDVVAVAAGVVIWSGDRYGYGNMVEIDHGNGYVTRYAHNSENLVDVGDRVAKGQRIALMGSSGRSTGPHVHFEVVRNGRSVNPLEYIRAER